MVDRYYRGQIETIGDAQNARWRIETIEEWNKWTDEIPFLEFPAGWMVQPTPPFAGAVARFRVRDKHGGEVSVYLDCFDRLGIFGEPYWELYPHDDDVYRCAMANTNELLSVIQDSLLAQREAKK